jgi:hypothetical protein
VQSGASTTVNVRTRSARGLSRARSRPQVRKVSQSTQRLRGGAETGNGALS